MRFSVSVPDELWGRAVDAADAEGPSAIVQLALRRFVAATPDDNRLGADLPLRRRARELGQRLAATAREEFTRGYEAGLAFAESSDYADIQAIHMAEYNFAKWVGANAGRFFDF